MSLLQLLEVLQIPDIFKNAK